MTRFKAFLLVAVMMTTVFGGMVATSDAAYRQRYGGWSYHTGHRYYYRSYYYKPYTTYTKYNYHYCIHYPSRPRYVYYYNPYRRVYWGRYDLEQKGYSELAAEDRKGKLEDISEDAFPEPGAMPSIPESEDGVKIDVPSKDDLPKLDTPKDAPGGDAPGGDAPN